MRDVRPKTKFRLLALTPPAGEVVVMNSAMVDKAIEMSLQSPRGRIIFPLHKTTSDPLQRMLNVLQPGSYIQPHRHRHPPKAESIVVIQGSIGFVSFDESGKVSARHALAAGTAEFGIDAGPDVYHTFFALKKNTVVFEVKPGPYSPSDDKDFASWAPVEGSESAAGYLAGLYELFSVHQ